MKKHFASYFTYRHPLYINNVQPVWELSSITQLFTRNSEFKTSASHCCENQFWILLFFMMMNYFYSNRLVWGGALLCGGNNSTTSSFFGFRWLSFFLDHQCMCIRHIPVSKLMGSIRCANRLSCRFVIRHIPVSNPTGSIRCANRLSCRFVNAYFNFPPPHCSQVSISIPKTGLSLCAQVIDWC